MESLNFPILSAVVYLPAIGALLMAIFVPGRRVDAIRRIALGVALADFFLSLAILPRFRMDVADFQLMERADWIPSLGIQYLMGTDGISLLLVLLTTVLGVLAILSSFSAITERVKEYMIALLILQTGMLGVFFALDIVLFYVFWEVMLIPMALLIGIWGGARRVYAAVKFFLFTLVGSLFMLIGFLVLYFSFHRATGIYTFDLIRLLDFSFPVGVQVWAFWALFLGFAIKVPLFPFHTWLPDAHVEAPTAGSVILAGVLLKMGTYGFIRFSLPMLPEASLQAIPAIAVLSIVGIIYGALVAWVQPDVKKLVAYSSVSHLGFVMLGLFTVTIQGVQGGVLQMINHGLSTGALFLLVGILYERRHTRMIEAFGGLAAQVPLFTAVFGIVTFSSIGLPGLNGFIGEFLILLGSYKARMWVFGALAASGVILGAVYMLSMFQRVMYGTLDKEENRNLPDLNVREMLTLVPIVILIFWIGIYPKPFLKMVEPSVIKVVSRLENARVNAGSTPLVLAPDEVKVALDKHGAAPDGE
ncbi:MAG: NADH-quinone oxidoreductase subunit M [bacterium]|nr:MAG: NADH-quinone oxidoreductase subunit M [bacterium]